MRSNETGGSSGISCSFAFRANGGASLQVRHARESGGATDADILDQLLGDRDISGYGRHQFHDLTQ